MSGLTNTVSICKISTTNISLVVFQSEKLWWVSLCLYIQELYWTSILILLYALFVLTLLSWYLMGCCCILQRILSNSWMWARDNSFESVSSTPVMVITAIRLHHSAVQPLYCSVSDAGQCGQLFDRAIHYTEATISPRRAERGLLWINRTMLYLNMPPLSPWFLQLSQPRIPRLCCSYNFNPGPSLPSAKIWSLNSIKLGP